MKMLRLAAAVVLLGIVATACGAGGANASGKASPSAADKEKALLQFAQCMRRNGVNIPDPTVDANGNVQIQRPHDANGSPPPDPNTDHGQHDKFRTARTACEKFLKNAFQGFTSEDRAKFQDQALKFAQCMRANGVNVPDPNFNQAPPSPGTNGERHAGPFGDLNRNDPKVAAALKTCRTKVFGNNGGPFGGGGFRFGGDHG